MAIVVYWANLNVNQHQYTQLSKDLESGYIVDSYISRDLVVSYDVPPGVTGTVVMWGKLTITQHLYTQVGNSLISNLDITLRITRLII